MFQQQVIETHRHLRHLQGSATRLASPRLCLLLSHLRSPRTVRHDHQQLQGFHEFSTVQRQGAKLDHLVQDPNGALGDGADPRDPAHQIHSTAQGQRTQAMRLLQRGLFRIHVDRRRFTCKKTIQGLMLLLPGGLHLQIFCSREATVTPPWSFFRLFPGHVTYVSTGATISTTGWAATDSARCWGGSGQANH